MVDEFVYLFNFFWIETEIRKMDDIWRWVAFFINFPWALCFFVCFCEAILVGCFCCWSWHSSFKSFCSLKTLLWMEIVYEILIFYLKSFYPVKYLRNGETFILPKKTVLKRARIDQRIQLMIAVFSLSWNRLINRVFFLVASQTDDLLFRESHIVAVIE